MISSWVSQTMVVVFSFAYESMRLTQRTQLTQQLLL